MSEEVPPLLVLESRRDRGLVRHRKNRKEGGEFSPTKRASITEKPAHDKSEPFPTASRHCRTGDIELEEFIEACAECSYIVKLPRASDSNDVTNETFTEGYLEFMVRQGDLNAPKAKDAIIVVPSLAPRRHHRNPIRETLSENDIHYLPSVCLTPSAAHRARYEFPSAHFEPVTDG